MESLKSLEKISNSLDKMSRSLEQMQYLNAKDDFLVFKQWLLNELKNIRAEVEQDIVQLKKSHVRKL